MSMTLGHIPRVAAHARGALAIGILHLELDNGHDVDIHSISYTYLSHPEPISIYTSRKVLSKYDNCMSCRRSLIEEIIETNSLFHRRFACEPIRNIHSVRHATDRGGSVWSIQCANTVTPRQVVINRQAVAKRRGRECALPREESIRGADGALRATVCAPRDASRHPSP